MRALKIVAALAGAVLVVLLALGGLSYVASESGEVVVLTTAGGDGGELQQRRIWVVDLEGRQWLRSGSPDSEWLARLRLNPVVTVERAGTAAQYTAAATPAMQEAVNEAMAAKYGWADRVIGMMFGREDAVPVELIPRT